MPTEQETEGLAACPNPWCEESKPVADEIYTGDGWFVRCCGCDVCTPVFPTEAEAIAAWQTRPSPTIAGAVEAEREACAKILEAVLEPLPELIANASNELTREVRKNEMHLLRALVDAIRNRGGNDALDKTGGGG